MTAGAELFARYAFPPNELGYCGPADTGQDQLASHAGEFDGAYPYLRTIAEAVGAADPLDEDVVHAYWVGGEPLNRVDSRVLLTTVRAAFAGQVTGVLAEVGPADVLAHHSFHVFAVYPWVRFLDRDPATPVRVMQACRIRSGIVRAVDDDWAVVSSCPLIYVDRQLLLGDPVDERLRWHREGTSLAPRPVVGQTVSAHWDWVCGCLDDAEVAALTKATDTTLGMVNAVRA